MSKRKSKPVSFDSLESRVLMSGSKQVMGFITDYELANGNSILSVNNGTASGSLNWSALSQVDYYSLLPNIVNGAADGAIAATTDSGKLYTTQIVPLQAAAASHGVAVWVAVGGGDGGAIADMNTLLSSATTDANRAAFASALASLCVNFHLGGVDLDWEPGSTGATEVTNFGNLVADLHGDGVNVSADGLPQANDIGNADTGSGSIFPFDSTALTNLSAINAEEYTDGSFTYPDTDTDMEGWATAVGAANDGKLQFGVGLYNSDPNSVVDQAVATTLSQGYGGLFVWTLADPATNPDLGEITSDLASDNVAVNPGSIDNLYGSVADLNSSNPIAGVTVYLDANGNGQLDPGETSDVTDSNGNFAFVGLAAGTYNLAQVVPTGYTQSNPPAGDEREIPLSQGSSANEEFFDTANTPPPNTASISGTVFNDKNANEIQDSGEPGISGVTVYIDSNNNGQLDSGEPTAITDSNGNFTLSNLAAGTYTVREVPPSGDGILGPFDGQYSVSVTAGQKVTGVDFADSVPTTPPAQSATVEGSVTNASGAGIAGVTVYLDANNNRALDTGELSTTTDLSGDYIFTDAPAGVANSLIVRQVVPAGDTQTSPTDNNGHHLPATLTPGGTYIESFADAAVPPPPTTATVTGTITTASGAAVAGVTVYLDTNNNRTLDSGELTTTTNASGVYTFTNAPAGVANSLIVRQVLPTGDTQVTPMSGNGIHLPTSLTAGATYGNENFVDTVPSTPSPAQLTGALIGTTGSWNNLGNTGANAFDGNLSTFFDAPTAGTAANPDWVGLDLGAQFNITSIAFAARSGYEFRMVGGVFQASNDPTFVTGVLNLYAVSYNPSSTHLTTINLVAGGSYRYVRYLAPVGAYGNVAEIEFFGTAASTTPTATQLTGAVIGTTGSYQNVGNTAANAFDGNLTTFFDAPTAGTNSNPDWVGLDLGAQYSITEIKFAARDGFEYRMVGGIFQASNDPTFTTGVVNLYTVASAPSSSSLTSENVNVSGTYRYVRYLAPAGAYGNIAEIQFFGTPANSNMALTASSPFSDLDLIDSL